MKLSSEENAAGASFYQGTARPAILSKEYDEKLSCEADCSLFLPLGSLFCEHL
jgi:hypothetical protein